MLYIKQIIVMVDITGMKFGKLTPIEVVGKNKRRQLMWKCKCDCGNESIICGSEMRLGRVKSCGCIRKGITFTLRQRNNYDLTHEYGIGYTPKREIFYFDLEDYDKIKPYSWRLNRGYVAAWINGKTTQMHRFILNASKIVDHINHNTVDNRKSNLRECTPAQNSMNRNGVAGITFDKLSNKWNAYIGMNYKRINLGYFKVKQDAIEARKKAEKEYFGKFACGEILNGTAGSKSNV